MLRRNLLLRAMRAVPCAAIAIAMGLSATTGAVAPAAAQSSGDVVVFAAASLKNALDEINTAFAADGGKPAKISYAGSSALAKQIESGAPADVFISADLDWMDYLEGKDAIRKDTRQDLLGNRIVLVAPASSAETVEIAPGFDLAGSLGDGRLAIANTDSVPAGRYGKEALEKLGAWEGVSVKVAQSDNVRAALALVSRGEAPLGIVYQTDAAADPGVKIVGVFPEDSHKPIIYPVAMTKASMNADAGTFLKFLTSDKARALFEKQGFNVLSAKASN